MFIPANPHTKAVHPLFLLLELPENPRQREDFKIRLEYLTELLQETSGEDSAIATPLWIQPYGAGCSPRHIQVNAYLMDRTWALLQGSEQLCLADALENLNRELTRSKALNYSMPMLPPTIFLLGNPAGTPDEYFALKELDEGAWFFHCRRFILWDGKLKNTDFANRFVDFKPKLFQKNPRILPMGRCPQWDVFLDAFRPSALHTFVNMDAVEKPASPAPDPGRLVHIDPAPKPPVPEKKEPWDIGPIGPGIPADRTPPPIDPWDAPLGPGIPADQTPPPIDPWDAPLGPGIPAEPEPPEIPMSGYMVPNEPGEGYATFDRGDDGFFDCPVDDSIPEEGYPDPRDFEIPQDGIFDDIPMEDPGDEPGYMILSDDDFI